MDVHQENETKIDLAQQQQINDNIMTTPQLPIELTGTTDLYHLNDDCLMEIFSKNSLSPVDLCSFAETCERFKYLTQRVFPKKLATQFRLYDDKSDDYVVVRESARDVERIFKHFGSRLVAVSVCGHETCRTMNLVVKHCVAGTLENLRISKVKISAALAIELKPIFQNLQRLTVITLPLQCSTKIFSNCGSLIELRIEDARNLKGILENNFPKLQRLELLRNVHGEAYTVGRPLLNFCKRHQTLKCFHLFTDDRGPTSGFLQALGSICKELEELAVGGLDHNCDAVVDFATFPNLKRLMLRRHSDRACSIQLDKLTSLEALKIVGDFDREQFWGDLSLLASLRELYVNCLLLQGTVPWASLTQLTKVCLTSEHNVVDVIRQLKNLEELEVRRVGLLGKRFILSEKEFFEIAELVKSRPNVLTLKCNFKFSLEYLLKISNTGYSNVKLVLLSEKLRYY